MSASMKEIAEKVGVSRATVSMVLNNKSNVLIGEKTRGKVLRVAKELGYRPNILARGLAMGKTFTLGVILPDVIYSYFTQIIEGIESEAHKKQYNVFICYSGNDSSRERKYIEALLEHRMDGILVAPLENNTNLDLYEHLNKTNFPLVLIDRYFPEIKLPFVGPDVEKTAYIAAKHLIEQGCKRILFLTKDLRCSYIEGQLKGYEKSLCEYGIPYRQDLIMRIHPYPRDPGFSVGKKVISDFLENSGCIFDGIFTVDDDIGAGVLKGLEAKNIKVPEEVAVIGADDLVMSQYLEIPLSSLAQQKYQMGAQAARIVLNKKRVEKKESIFLEPQLKIRQSSQRMLQKKQNKKGNSREGKE